MPTLDLSGAKDRGEADWIALPEGNYRATIDSAEMGATKGGEGAKLPEGTPSINVRFRVDDEDMPDDSLLPDAHEDENGNEVTPMWSRTVYKGFVIAPKKYEKKQDLDNILYGFLKAVGFDVEEIKSGKFNLEMDDLPGRGCVLNITQREYKGKMQNNIRYINEIDSTESSMVI